MTAMTELVKLITEAEAAGSEEKRLAAAQAAKIVEDAETQAAAKEKTTQEVCKAFRETQIKAADAEVQAVYEKAVAEKEAEAKEACLKILQSVEAQISRIVGRVTSGDC